MIIITLQSLQKKKKMFKRVLCFCFFFLLRLRNQHLFIYYNNNKKCQLSIASSFSHTIWFYSKLYIYIYTHTHTHIRVCWKVHRLTMIHSWNVAEWGFIFLDSAPSGSHTSSISVAVHKSHWSKMLSTADMTSLTKLFSPPLFVCVYIYISQHFVFLVDINCWI